MSSPQISEKREDIVGSTLIRLGQPFRGLGHLEAVTGKGQSITEGCSVCSLAPNCHSEEQFILYRDLIGIISVRLN